MNKYILLTILLAVSLFTAPAYATIVQIFIEDEKGVIDTPLPQTLNIPLDESGNGSVETVLWNFGTTRFQLREDFSQNCIANWDQENIEWGQKTRLYQYSFSTTGVGNKSISALPGQNIKIRIEIEDGKYFVTLIDPETDPEITESVCDYSSVRELPPYNRNRLFIEKPYYVTSLICSWNEKSGHNCIDDKLGFVHNLDILEAGNPAGAKTIKINGKDFIVLDDPCDISDHTNQIHFTPGNNDRNYTGTRVSIDINDFQHTLNTITGTTETLVSDLINYDPPTNSNHILIDRNETTVYYDLNGKRLTKRPTIAGIYIRVHDNQSEKVMISR